MNHDGGERVEPAEQPDPPGAAGRSRPDLATLADRVRAAFADVPYPGDDNIASSGAWEPAAIAEALRGRDWRDLSGYHFDYGSAPSFLTPQAFCYYLPALLLNLLDGLEDRGSPAYFDSLAGSTLFSLEPRDRDGGFLARRVALLSRAQRAAVRDVVARHVAEERAGIEMRIAEDIAEAEAIGDAARREAAAGWQRYWQGELEALAAMLAFWERAAEAGENAPEET